jgi:hypothetical protein
MPGVEGALRGQHLPEGRHRPVGRETNDPTSARTDHGRTSAILRFGVSAAQCQTAGGQIVSLRVKSITRDAVVALNFLTHVVFRVAACG